ncbi:MAG: RNA polymerase subunit sigma-70, partial [Planctomycetes bacterium]|nr:RNA polymerase subunit sigma-70 [Planctomycetota bacterium]
MLDQVKKTEFLGLVEAHQNIIHKICNLYGRTEEDRHDLSQEIVCQLWKSYPRFRGDSKFTTWMYRVALN